MDINGTRVPKPQRTSVFATRKCRILLIVLSVLIAACVGVSVVAVYRFAETARLPDPDPEAILAHYLSNAENDVLLQGATGIQGKELGMGQGVYLRFEASQESVVEFLNQEAVNEHSLHHPYVAVPCDEFYGAYAEWADDKYDGWWRPRDVVSPECYVTQYCEYFLLDNEGKTVYYYFFPDFLGYDFCCVNAQGERETVPEW